MQYPIIDNLIYAYQRNGWTGNSVLLEQGGIYSSDGSDYDTPTRVRSLYMPVDDINTVLNNSYNNNIRLLAIRCYTRTRSYIGPATTTQEDEKTVITNIPNNTYYIRFAARKLDDSDILPIEALFTVNGTFEDNFSHRLKLPLPYYFPHPVIDALISAADGQHTEEEKEILRHYLTPLGIGGI